MRILFGLVLVIGVALAGFAVHMTRGYMSTYQAELDREKAMRAEEIQTEEIYIATALINFGDPITPELVKKVKWPVEALPKDAFRTEKELFPEGLDATRVALRAIEPMEPLMAVKLSAPGEDAGVASRLSKGKRAFAIKVDVSTGVSGLLRAGDRVDIYWTGRLPGTDTEATKLIETSIPLVAVDQSSDGDRKTSTIGRTVTVEASPTQVAGLATAQSSGRLSLSLVGRNDDTIVGGIEVDQRTLLGIADVQIIAEKPKDKICTVRTRKGSEIMEMPIPCSD